MFARRLGFVRREVHSVSSSAEGLVGLSLHKRRMIVYALVSVEKNVLAEFAAEVGECLF